MRRCVSIPRGYFVLTVLACAAVLFFAGVLYLNSRQQEVTAQQICEVLRGIVARSGAEIGKTPGSPGYAYYQEHPDELAATRASNQRLLDELPC